MLLSWRVPSVVLVNQTGCRQCPTSGHPVCTEARGKVEHSRTPPLKVCFRDSCFSCLLPLPFAHFISHSVCLQEPASVVVAAQSLAAWPLVLPYCRLEPYFTCFSDVIPGLHLLKLSTRDIGANSRGKKGTPQHYTVELRKPFHAANALFRVTLNTAHYDSRTKFVFK